MSISTILLRKNLGIVTLFCLQMRGILIMIVFYTFEEKQLSLVRSFCHLLSNEADDETTRPTQSAQTRPCAQRLTKGTQGSRPHCVGAMGPRSLLVGTILVPNLQRPCACVEKTTDDHADVEPLPRQTKTTHDPAV